MNLVIGSSGLIGRTLLAALRAKNLPAIGTSRHATDQALLLELSFSDRFAPPKGPGVAFLCAGESRLDICATRPHETRDANVIGTLQLAEKLQAAGFRIVFLSSNLVFDGTQPDAKPATRLSPTCEYGRQKAEVEQSLPRGSAVVRLTKIAESLQPRLDAWAAALRAGQPIETSALLPLAPIPLADVISTLVSLADEFVAGTFQLSAPDQVTYRELALLLAQSLGADSSLVQTNEDRVLRAFSSPPRHATLALVGPKPRLALPNCHLALAPMIAASTAITRERLASSGA